MSSLFSMFSAGLAHIFWITSYYFYTHCLLHNINTIIFKNKWYNQSALFTKFSNNNYDFIINTRFDLFTNSYSINKNITLNKIDEFIRKNIS